MERVTYSVLLAVTLSSSVLAGEQHTSRTYFGRPGVPYGAADYRNPWTGTIFGVRFCCKTPEDRYARFLKDYQIAMIKHQKHLQRLDWIAYDNHVQGGGEPDCCNADCDGSDRECIIGGRGLFGFLVPKHHGGDKWATGKSFDVMPPPYMTRARAMNREDAVRYLEGFQYYPPHHLLHSPRDFYMFDARYQF